MGGVLTGFAIIGAIIAAGYVVGRTGLLGPHAQFVMSRLAFFVLTIASERLELSRLAPTPPMANWLLVAAVAACAAAAVVPLVDGTGVGAPRVLGLSLVAIGAWQLVFDVARHTVRRPGLPRAGCRPRCPRWWPWRGRR